MSHNLVHKSYNNSDCVNLTVWYRPALGSSMINNKTWNNSMNASLFSGCTGLGGILSGGWYGWPTWHCIACSLCSQENTQQLQIKLLEHTGNVHSEIHDVVACQRNSFCSQGVDMFFTVLFAVDVVVRICSLARPSLINLLLPLASVRSTRNNIL